MAVEGSTWPGSPPAGGWRVNDSGNSALRHAQLVFQVLPYGRPFRRHDAVDAGVAQRAVGRALVAAQNAVELGAQPLDGAAALAVEGVGADRKSARLNSRHVHISYAVVCLLQ